MMGKVVGYSEWKWKVLQKRRYFFFLFLNFYFIFLWSSNLRILNKFAQHSNDDYMSQFARSLQGIPIAFIILHMLMIIIYLLSDYGQRLLRNRQGKRLVHFFALSSIVFMVLIQFPWDESFLLRNYSAEKGLLFITALAILGSVLHHIGLVLSITWVSIIISLILFCIFSATENISAVGFIAVILALICFYIIAYLEEFEYKRSYDSQKQADNILGSTTGSRPEDLAHAFLAVDKSMYLMYESMNREGISAISKGPDSRWNTNVAIIQEQRYLCQAMYAAIAPDNFSKLFQDENKSQFRFQSTCNVIFAMMEAALGHALPMFVDQSQPEIFITGHAEIFEIIVLLLIHDHIRGSNRGVCKFSYENQDSDYCNIIMTSVNMSSFYLTEKQEDKTYSSVKAATKAVVSVSKRIVNSVGEFLSIEGDNGNGRRPGFENFARILVNKFFSGSSDKQDADVEDGLRSCRMIIQIPSHIVSSTQVTAPSSVGNKLSQSWLFISENEKYQDIKEKLEKMFIPKSFCLAQDLRTHPHKYLVAVLAEGHLANFAGGLSHDVPSVASSVVILRDVENSMESSGDFSNRFDVVEISLPTKTRMSDFFNRLLVLYSHLPGRPLGDEEINSLSRVSRNISSSGSGVVTLHRMFLSLNEPIKAVVPTTGHRSSIRRPLDRYSLKILSFLGSFDAEYTANFNSKENKDLLSNCLQRCRKILTETNTFQINKFVESLDFKIGNSEENRVYALLSPSKKRLRCLYVIFGSLLDSIRGNIKEKQFDKLFQSVTECIQKSKNLQNDYLARYFSVLQEVVTLMIETFHSLPPPPEQDLMVTSLTGDLTETEEILSVSKESTGVNSNKNDISGSSSNSTRRDGLFSPLVTGNYVNANESTNNSNNVPLSDQSNKAVNVIDGSNVDIENKDHDRAYAASSKTRRSISVDRVFNTHIFSLLLEIPDIIEAYLWEFVWDK